MNNHKHFVSLEAMRGISAILILLFHSPFQSSLTANRFIGNSFLFVNLFFILSGFIIAYVYINKINQFIHFKEFLLLRIGRIYPLHLFMLFVWLPYITAKYFLHYNYGWGINPALKNNIASFLTNIILVHHFDSEFIHGWNYPSWTVGTEFYTYLIFALLLLYISNKGLKLVSSITLSAIFYFVYFYFKLEIGVFEAFIKTIGGFFLGVSFYQIYQMANLHDNIIKNRLLATIPEFISLAFVFYAVRNGSEALIILSFFTVLVCFVLQCRGLVSSLFQNKAFQLVGRLSYSIYLTHAIVLCVVGNIFQYVLNIQTIGSNVGGKKLILFSGYWGEFVNISIILLVIGISWFTYQHIENPFRKKIRRIAVSKNQTHS